jgi:hypothetical protein
MPAELTLTPDDYACSRASRRMVDENVVGAEIAQALD